MNSFVCLVLCQRVQELNEQFHSSRAKMAENIAVAVKRKEEVSCL